MDQKAVIKGYSAGIFFAILVGFSFLGVKVSVPLGSPLQILTYRYDFAFLALAIALLFRFAKIDLKRKPKRDLFLTAGSYIGFMILQVVGLNFATSIEGAIFFAVIPMIVKIIAAIFLKEGSTLLQNVAMCLTVGSLLTLIVLSSSEITFNVAGTALLLLSSLAMAISNVFMRYVRNQYSPMEITATIIIGGFLLFNIVTLTYGVATGTLTTYFAPAKNLGFCIATAYLGIGCILLSAQLMSYAMSKMEAVKAAVFGNVSTAISIVAGTLILGEPLYVYHVICTSLIICGVVGLNAFGRQKAGKKIRSQTDE